MGQWGEVSASHVLRALYRNGWKELRRSGSHRALEHADGRRYTWAFHDGVKIGPKMMARIAKHTGLKPSDI